MSGILLSALAIVWLCTVIGLTRRIARMAKSLGVKVLVGTAIFPALLIAPLVDEVVGAIQFDALCMKYAVQEIDDQNAMNRHVVYVPRGPDKFVAGTTVRIRIDPIVYRDAETNQVLVRYHTLHASGGWLIRTLGLSETNAPLLFRSGCAPKEQDAFKKKFNITVVN